MENTQVHDEFWEGVGRARANLTDSLYQEMVANPDKLMPYAVIWPKVTRELQNA